MYQAEEKSKCREVAVVAGHNIKAWKNSGAENFHKWTVLIRAYLCKEGLSKTVEADAAGVLDTDEKQMARAVADLFFSLDTTPLGNVEDLTSSKEIWNRLKELYGGAGPHKLVRFLRKLCTIKLENFATCDEYMQTVTHTTNDLEDTKLGKVFHNDDVLIAFLLAGLPDDYEPLCQSIDEAVQTTTADDFKRRIRETWTRRNKENQQVFESGVLHAVPGFFSQNGAYHSGQRDNPKTRGKAPRCYKCNMIGLAI